MDGRKGIGLNEPVEILLRNAEQSRRLRN